jgi:hypothetical protein
MGWFLFSLAISIQAGEIKMFDVSQILENLD